MENTNKNSINYECWVLFTTYNISVVSLYGDDTAVQLGVVA